MNKIHDRIKPDSTKAGSLSYLSELQLDKTVDKILEEAKK